MNSPALFKKGRPIAPSDVTLLKGAGYLDTHVLNPVTGLWDRARLATAGPETRFVYDDATGMWFKLEITDEAI